MATIRDIMAPGIHRALFGPGTGLIIQVIIILLVIFIVWWVLRGRNGNESALAILNKRYAKGEIKRKEYLNLKKDIGSGVKKQIKKAKK